MLTNIMRGADPELFLVDSKTKKPVTSIGLVGGSKSNPRQIGGGFALQEDNVAVEFNIPPAKDKASFISSLEFAKGFIKQEMETKGISLAIVPTMMFTKEQLDHPQARELGCEPDYNAWTQEINPRPRPPQGLRSSGGHLHISWDNPDPIDQVRVIKAHDLFCGVASLAYDDSQERRRIYGKAGAMRFKGYGVEYRTLSNFWIKSTELMEWLYNQSEKAIAFINDEKVLNDTDAQNIQDCINNSDYNLMAILNEKFQIL